MSVSRIPQQKPKSSIVLEEDFLGLNKPDFGFRNDLLYNDLAFNDPSGFALQPNPFNLWENTAKNNLFAQTANMNQIGQLYMNQNARNIQSILELQMNILDQKKIMNEVFHLMLTNNLISSKISELTTEKNQLLMKISVLEGRKSQLPKSKLNFLRPTNGGSNYLTSVDATGKRKRQRRLANQIDRHYRCPIQNCMKSYGSEGSLFQHIKIKHPNFNINSISGLSSLNRMRTQKQLYAKIEEFLSPFFKQPHLQSKFCMGTGIVGLPVMGGVDVLNEFKNTQIQNSLLLNSIVK